MSRALTWYIVLNYIIQVCHGKFTLSDISWKFTFYKKMLHFPLYFWNSELFLLVAKFFRPSPLFWRKCNSELLQCVLSSELLLFGVIPDCDNFFETNVCHDKTVSDFFLFGTIPSGRYLLILTDWFIVNLWSKIHIHIILRLYFKIECTVHSQESGNIGNYYLFQKSLFSVIQIYKWKRRRLGDWRQVLFRYVRKHDRYGNFAKKFKCNITYLLPTTSWCGHLQYYLYPLQIIEWHWSHKKNTRKLHNWQKQNGSRWI